MLSVHNTIAKVVSGPVNYNIIICMDAFSRAPVGGSQVHAETVSKLNAILSAISVYFLLIPRNHDITHLFNL